MERIQKLRRRSISISSKIRISEIWKLLDFDGACERNDLEAASGLFSPFGLSVLGEGLRMGPVTVWKGGFVLRILSIHTGYEKKKETFFYCSYRTVQSSLPFLTRK